MKNTFDMRSLRALLMKLDEEKKPKNQLGDPSDQVPLEAPLASRAPAAEKTAAEPQAMTVASEEKAKEPNIEPSTEKTPAENFAALADAVKSEEGKALRAEGREGAKDQVTRGNERSESAAKKNDALYEALLAFTGKQEGRYDDLLSSILNGDTSESEAGRALLARYEALGERAAEHALASVAADNGGNPDSYAAAEARRQLSAFAEAGEEAAAELYDKQIDRLLSALGASSSDMSKLFGLIGDNAENDADAAKTHLGVGADLFYSLLDAESGAEKQASDTLAKLFDRMTDGSVLGGISPMQIDSEYYALIGNGKNGGHSYRDALLILWDKYPTMRSYILEKYKTLSTPSYSFKD